MTEQQLTRALRIAECSRRILAQKSALQRAINNARGMSASYIEVIEELERLLKEEPRSGDV
jgi:hypothetical protein